MKDFIIEERSAFEQPYLSVDLADLTQLSEVQRYLKEVECVKTVNISQGKREHLSVYPTKFYTIQEVAQVVAIRLEEYFTSLKQTPAPKPALAGHKPSPFIPDKPQYVDKPDGCPTVLISHAWNGKSHEEWVIKFATELEKQHGVHVLCDLYNLGGTDIVTFMEHGMKIADRILVLCTPKYKEKSESLAKSGVRYEKTLMSYSLFDDGDTPRFIPILEEGTYDTSAPTLLKNRNGYDLSTPDRYIINIKKLVADLWNKPLYSRPKRGKMPDFLKPETDSVAVSAGVKLPSGQASAKTPSGSNPVAIVASSQINLKDLFTLQYIPVFDRIFELLNVKDYHLWMRMLASDGESEMLQSQYQQLNELIHYCKTRPKNSSFTTFDILIENIAEIVEDLMHIYNQEPQFLPDGRIRLRKFYHQDETNDDLLVRYINIGYMIGDLCMELTRLLNYMLENIRTIEPTYMVDTGMLSIDDIHHGYPLEYQSSEKSSKPYPGFNAFKSVRLTRAQSYGVYPGIKSKID